MNDKHRCADCGFLTLRESQSRLLVEAEQSVRTSGQFPPTGPHRSYETIPLCFVMAFDLQAEHRDTPVSGSRSEELTNGHPQKVKHFVILERECNGFMPWHHGFSPKEHLEMNLLEIRRAAEHERSESDRRWRESQAEQARQWRKDDEEQQRRDREEDRKWKWRELAIMGGVVTLVSAAVSLACAFISRSS